jgi:hypothetical protein
MHTRNLENRPEEFMTTRLKLKPGQKGTKKLLDIYGDALVCVRYRYDEERGTRVKTAEIIVETKDWRPPPPKFKPGEIVRVRIAFAETVLKKLAKAGGGRWDPEARLWSVPYGKVKGTALEKHIILDAVPADRIKESI